MTVIVKLMMKKVINCAGEDCSSSSEESDDDDDGSNTDCMDTDSDLCTTQDENEDDHVSNLFNTTRSGRSTTTWRCSYFTCKYMNKQVCLSHCPSVIFAVTVYL